MDNQTHQDTQADQAEIIGRKKGPLIKWSTNVIEILEHVRSKQGVPRYMYSMNRYTDGGQRYVVGLIDGQMKAMRRDKFKKKVAGIIHSDHSRWVATEQQTQREEQARLREAS